MSTKETKKKKKKCDKKRGKVTQKKKKKGNKKRGKETDASDNVTRRKRQRRETSTGKKLKAGKRLKSSSKVSSSCEENSTSQKQGRKDNKIKSGSQHFKQPAITRIEIKNAGNSAAVTSLDPARSDVVVPNKPTSPCVLSVATTTPAIKATTRK